MENILQEATKEESGVEEPTHRGHTEVPEVKEEAPLAKESSMAAEGPVVLYQEPQLDDATLRSHQGPSLSLFSQGIPEHQDGHNVLSSSLQAPLRGEDSQEVPVEQPQVENIAEDRENVAPAVPVDAKVGLGISQSSSLLPSQVPFETRGPHINNSVHMLLEDKVKSESGPQLHHRPCPASSGRFSGKDMLPVAPEPRSAERPQWDSVLHRTSSPGNTLSCCRLLVPCR